VSLRNDQPQASTSGPAHPSHSAQTSTTSGGTPTTASVQPNMKRPREAPDSDSQMSEERAGPSGLQKKARTISSTEQFAEYDQVSSGTADALELAGVSGSQDLESDSSAQHLDAELREVGSSSQMGDSVGTSFEIAASSGVRSSYAPVVSSDTSGVGCSGQANSTSLDDEEAGEILDIEQGVEDMEEGEISEDVEEGDIAEEDELNDDQDLEPSNEEELAEVVDAVEGEEGLEASSDEEEGEEEERESQPAPEDVNEDNSSEPSSSTGTSQLRSSQQQQQQQQQQQVAAQQAAAASQALGIETDVGQVMNGLLKRFYPPFELLAFL